MTTTVVNWFSRCAADRRAHEQQWTPARVIGPDGLSEFQARAEITLASAGYEIDDREVRQLSGGGPVDLYVTGTIGGHRIFLYQDGVELQAGSDSLRLEDWDTRGPADMIGRLLAQLGKLQGGAA